MVMQGKPANVSQHFSWDEFACRDRMRTPYPIDWRETRAVDLAAELERIRSRVGKPLTLLSVYRTPEYNASASVKGSLHSQHCEGRAADVACPSTLTVEAFANLIRQMVDGPGSLIRGLGVYPRLGFCHIDIRPVKKLVEWTE